VGFNQALKNANQTRNAGGPQSFKNSPSTTVGSRAPWWGETNHGKSIPIKCGQRGPSISGNWAGLRARSWAGRVCRLARIWLLNDIHGRTRWARCDKGHDHKLEYKKTNGEDDWQSSPRASPDHFANRQQPAGPPYTLPVQKKLWPLIRRN